MLFSRLKQWFSRSEAPKRAAGSSDQDFALLHHRFKLFLTAWNKPCAAITPSVPTGYARSVPAWRRRFFSAFSSWTS